MKKDLLTEKELVSLLLYFHVLLKVIILDRCFSRFLNCTNCQIVQRIKLTASGKVILNKVLK